MKFGSRAKKIALCGLSGAVALSVGVVGFGPSTFAQALNDSSQWVNFKSADGQTLAGEANGGSWNSGWEQYKTDWETTKNNWEQVSLAPGKTASELNFAWLSKTAEEPQVRISTTKEGIATGKTFKGTQAEATDVVDEADGHTSDKYYSNKVTVSGLEASTQYYYQVFKDGAWETAVHPYKTGDTSKFSFLFVGDPQIGSSKTYGSDVGDKANADKKQSSSDDKNYSARNDSYNWDKVLDQATQANPNVSFMVSAGDQVQEGNNEAEYAGFLSASALESLPVATTIGNHELRQEKKNYSYHFNTPNLQTDAATTTGATTTGGTDYYYRYGDALFIVLDTNNYNCKTHENLIEKAVNENKDAKWRIVTFHQDVYGSGYEHSASDGMVLRTQLTPIFDKYKIDLALEGHDHTYSRTYAINGDGQTHKAYDEEVEEIKNSSGDPENNVAEYGAYYQDNNCYLFDSSTGTGTVTNPKGTIYLTGNSASGSKFYNLMPQRQDYIAERSQTWTPSYSVIDVDGSSLSIKTYDATTGKEVAGTSALTIKKETVKSTTGIATGKTATAGKGASKATYKVTSNKKSTATYVKCKASKKSITVPATVKIKGKTYKVTAVAAKALKGKKATKVTLGKNVKTIKKNAFKGSKAKTIVVKTKKLTKKSVKGSLKGSKVKTVKVNVGKTKVDKKYVKKYKKAFTKKNCGKKVTVK